MKYPVQRVSSPIFQKPKDIKKSVADSICKKSCDEIEAKVKKFTNFTDLLTASLKKGK